MSIITRTEFKRWQPLPTLPGAAIPGERENRPPVVCETGRAISRTAPRKTQGCRLSSAFSESETPGEPGTLREI